MRFSQLYTAFSNVTLEAFAGVPTDHLYENCENAAELAAACNSGILAEDRFLMAATGALPSEIWA